VKAFFQTIDDFRGRIRYEIPKKEQFVKFEYRLAVWKEVGGANCKNLVRRYISIYLKIY
jgi:hypothetical protein